MDRRIFTKLALAGVAGLGIALGARRRRRRNSARPN